MLPDYSVKHVPGLYPRVPNAGCCSRCGRRIVRRRWLGAVAVQQNAFSLASVPPFVLLRHTYAT